MIKNKALLGILFFLSSLFTAYGSQGENKTAPEIRKTKTARVVGYLSSDSFSRITFIEFCRLTHLNIAFANPDKQGNLIFNGDIDAVVTYAKSVNPNIKISISLAGGVISSEQAFNWAWCIDKPENRSVLIQNIKKFVETHNLDGVDVDLEWGAVTSGYSDFVIDLRKSLPVGKLITAALPNTTRFEAVNNTALNTFDFINIMAYDSTGPWSPNKKEQHSSLEFAKEGVEFWHKLQNVPSDKLTLGVPFYGYDFTSETVTSAAYSEIVAAGSQFADQDEAGMMYYNGRSTIERKVEFASQNAGGIMIWELAQDSFDKYSLLNVIHKKYTSLKTKTSGLCGN
ncbi:glycosyl hydrolase family 18 protein [Flavobacterium gelatinilyticum]|uniref:glycosyl hydrolase family 18 protein n=1 Tax=Flavobacterium gelatinilyticum TaxID=3003260 RepID=UPI002481891A|nr:glycosyl hydrolase family 18 protein [Flavobacterium gelatinilyticum]